MCGVQHGQIVIGLGQLRIVLGQLGERLDSVVGFARFRLDDAFEKAHLRITGLGGQVLLGPGQSICMFTVAHQLADLRVVVGLGGQGGCHDSSQGGGAPKRECGHEGGFQFGRQPPQREAYTAADCS